MKKEEFIDLLCKNPTFNEVKFNSDFKVLGLSSPLQAQYDVNFFEENLEYLLNKYFSEQKQQYIEYYIMNNKTEVYVKILQQYEIRFIKYDDEKKIHVSFPNQIEFDIEDLNNISFFSRELEILFQNIKKKISNKENKS